MAFAFFCVFVFNDNAAASDWRWSAGVQQWYCTWEYEKPEGEKSDDDSVFMGPDVKLQKGSIFCEMNLLFGLRDSKIEDAYRSEADNQLNWDLDFTFGYFLHPRFAVLSGFKRIDVDYYDLYFGVIGATFNIPIQTLSFICSIEYLPIGDVSGLQNIDDVNGWSTEAGLAYNFSRHVLYGGYKYQIINLKDKDSDNDRDNTLYGIILCYNYNF